MKVVIILPTYNEKGNIERLITILEEEIFPKIKNHEMNILVADDNSPDGTADEVKKLMKKWKNIDLNIGEKRGLGAAYVRAMAYAIEKLKADIMFEMDADFFHDPEKIPQFLQKIDEGYDFVIGTRYSNGGSIPPNWKIHRKIFSIFGNLLVRIILTKFSIHDWTGGYRAIKKEVFLKERDELETFKGYTFQVALLYKAIRDGFKVAEVPFKATDRFLGRSKIAPLEYIFNLLKYVISTRFFEILHSPFPKYVIIGFTGYLINAIALEFFRRFFDLPPNVSGSLGGELAVIFNFAMNNYWTFSANKITSPFKIFLKFIQFNLVSLGSLAIIGWGVGFGTNTFGDTVFVRQIALVLTIGFLVIPYSYSAYNIFIWKRWRIPFLSELQKIAG